MLILICLFITICSSGCVITLKPDLGLNEDLQTITFVEAQFYDYFDDKECVALLFDYTNNSGESKCASDGFVIGVRQNGKVLDSLWLSKDSTIAGTITPSTEVSSGSTDRVAWYFILRDDSPIAIVISDGQEFTLDYRQVVKCQ